MYTYSKQKFKQTYKKLHFSTFIYYGSFDDPEKMLVANYKKMYFVKLSCTP